MTFSNVNIFRSVVVNLKASEPGATADKITKGGAFSPNTQESIAILRAETDNQWENSFIIKYESLMQNRLNRLRQDLTNAYKALLEVSSVQQIRENGLNASNSAITDVYGTMLANSGEAFKKLKYYDDETAFNAEDATNGSSSDGVPSYLLDTKLNQYAANRDSDKINKDGKVEMRKLFVTGPALQIVNSAKVTMRTEEVPPKFTEVLGGVIPFPIGEKAFTSGQKLAEYSADVKSGGFWTAINYLYNFAPREMKYNYPTAYSTTSEEAGTRQVGSTQATLFNSQILDARDVFYNDGGAYKNGGATEDSPIPDYGALNGEKPPNGSRVKWSTSNANDGYTTERSPAFNQKTVAGNDINDAKDDRAITRRRSDNDNKFDLNGIMSNANDVMRSSWIMPNIQKQTVYGTEDLTSGTDRFDDRIKWEYGHDGSAAADMNQDGKVNGSDNHVAVSAFINHYTVQTQSVELNSSSGSYGKVKAMDYNGLNPDGTGKLFANGEQLTLRSAGIDGSAEHVFNDANNNKVMDQVDNSNFGLGNNSYGDSKDINDKLLLAGSSKVSKNFDGKFVSNLYNLQSFNGQNIATETANININSRNDKEQVVIAEYEGFKRAESMGKGLSDDYFSQINNSTRSEEDARRLAKKLETEINSSNMVDTDWHYSEYTNASADKVMFRYISSVSYTGAGGLQSVPVNYKLGITNGTANVGNPTISTNGSKLQDATVGFRKPFKLEPRDFQTAVYSNSANADIYINTPTYTDRNVFVDMITTNSVSSPPPDLVVNGRIVPPVSAGRYNLAGFLQAGDNVIGAQVTFGSTGTANSFKIISSTGNDADIATLITERFSTGRTSNGDDKADKLNQTNIVKPLSSWQSKVMVGKINVGFFNTTYSDPDKAALEYQNSLDTLASVNTATRVKETNSFSRLLTEALNKKEYQDIFSMGLLNTTAGKTMIIKAQVSAPTGGSVNATMDIQYDPITNKFILVQSKFDGFGG